MTISTDEANDGTYNWDTSNVSCPGTYWMNVSVYDSGSQTTFDEGNYSFQIICPIVQTYPPVIIDVIVDPNPQTAGNEVTISAEITDQDTDLEDLDVTITVYGPDGSSLGTYSMDYIEETGWFEYTSNFSIVGNYTFTIYAEDNDDNSDSKDGNFVMEPKLAPESEPSIYNWKPLIALGFTIILLLLGILISYKRPIRFKGVLQKDRFYTFILGVLPFAIVEASTGVISYYTGLFCVPPLFGAGMIVDLLILILGIIACMIIFKKGQNPRTSDAEGLPNQSDSIETGKTPETNE